MPEHPFKQVDVFTQEPFQGNPLAVIFDADSLTGTHMQRIARWTNLSETVFVQSSDKGDYRLRIFTPRTELPFAGHPTIGAAHAAREAGIVLEEKTDFIQDCKAGPIPLRVEDDFILARVPRPKIKGLPSASILTDVFGGAPLVEPMLVDVGPVWATTRLADASRLYGLEIDFVTMAAFNVESSSIGVNLYALDNGEIHVRSFAPADGIPEDPVCGSGNAAVGAHIKATGFDAEIGRSYTARQGSALGRDGRIRVRLDGEDVFIGGNSVTVVNGAITV